MATKMIAVNKAAHRNYDITETIEAGIVLRGPEVKSLRESSVKLNDAYARFERNELWLMGFHLAPYSRAGIQGMVDPTRKRKLLLHRYELTRLSSRMDQEVLQLIPMAMYFNDGRVKVELGVGKGRKVHDKRQIIAKRDSDREARRELTQRSR